MHLLLLATYNLANRLAIKSPVCALQNYDGCVMVDAAGAIVESFVILLGLFIQLFITFLCWRARRKLAQGHLEEARRQRAEMVNVGTVWTDEVLLPSDASLNPPEDVRLVIIRKPPVAIIVKQELNSTL